MVFDEYNLNVTRPDGKCSKNVVSSPALFLENAMECCTYQNSLQNTIEIQVFTKEHIDKMSLGKNGSKS